jgi:hypothetical protein
MGLPDAEVAKSWGGKVIVDRSGATIGACTQVYTDDVTGLPEWATARMGTATVLLPLVDAVADGDRVQVAVDRDDVVRAPRVADQQHISDDEEALLYRHYGIAFSRERSPSQLPAGEGPPPPARPGLAAVAAGLAGRVSDRRQALLIAAVVVAALAGALGALTDQARRRQLRSVGASPTARTTSCRSRSSLRRSASSTSAGVTARPRAAPRRGPRAAGAPSRRGSSRTGR